MMQFSRQFISALRRPILATSSSFKFSFSTASANAQLVKCEDSGNGVRTLTLNQPKKRNPLSEETMQCLTDNVTNVPDSIGAIIIRGEGPVFSAGHNLREFSKEEACGKHDEVLGTCAKLMLSIVKCPVPVIASVHGVAAAAGCQLVASCDLAIATESARFSLPGVVIGLFCITPSVAVARNMSPKKVAEMLYTGDFISSQEALTHGFIGSVVADDELEKATTELAHRITRHSRPVVRLGKKALREHMAFGHDLEGAYRVASKMMADNLKFVDTQNGISGFLNKEKPNWTHKDEKIN